MKSLWSDADAQAAIDRYAPTHGEDIALRVYTSCIIGQDDKLVLHGGGNTSCKTSVKDVFGEPVEVLAVKGSGWDLGAIEPAGLPAVELDALRKLRVLSEMSDEQMVNEVRRQLLDVSAPTPSVEALLHAFLPHRFVDHTHADAIVVLTNQPAGEAHVRAALGDNIVILPWIMPGFPLAKAVADAYEAKPDCEGVILMNHGIFTFADNAKGSYERMIDLVDRAERYLAQQARSPAMLATNGVGDPSDREAAEIAARLRGAVALRKADGTEADTQRMLVAWRKDADLVAFSQHAEMAALVAQGPLTPDHVIRTKGAYLALTREQAQSADATRQAVAAYVQSYEAYFADNAPAMSFEAKMLDPYPRVAVVEGFGLFAFGADLKSANIAADIAEHTLRGKAQGAALDRYLDLPWPELFEMEYWSLEQAKLGKKKAPRLAGRVALITGAAGAIGYGIAEALCAAGAHVMLTDLSEDGLAVVQEKLRASFGAAKVASCTMDVTDPDSVRRAFDCCGVVFGGMDVLVPNAGIAHVSSIEDMDVSMFDKVVDVNLKGTLTVLKEAARVFRLQGTGGSVVVQASKNVFAPGAEFGAYSAGKAGAMQLGRIAAMELAPLGVRVNMINADAVFGDEVKSGLWETVGPDRMKSRNLDPQGLRDYYRERSLLKVPVTPRQVGEAVVFFAAETTPTTGAVLPVDAGVPGAFPR